MRRITGRNVGMGPMDVLTGGLPVERITATHAGMGITGTAGAGSSLTPIRRSTGMIIVVISAECAGMTPIAM